jgi:hypothetical protein
MHMAVGQRTLVVPVSLNVPVGVSIAGVVVLGAGNLNLLETPLREVRVASSQVAAHDLVLETEGGCKSAELAVITGGSISHNLDLPVILVVTNSQVTIARNFLLTTAHGSGDIVRVEVAASSGVDQTNVVAVSNVS